MREIKFRVWDSVNETYFIGNKIFALPNREIETNKVTLTNCDIYKFEQFVGLKDVNNVEIYDGDEVISCDDDVIYIVEYRAKTLSFDLRIKGKETYDCPLSYMGNLGRLKVIGNIHTDNCSKGTTSSEVISE